jgi:hypothetical protein
MKEDVNGGKEEERIDGRDRDPFLPKSKPGELVFTSEVSIVPNVFPFEDCYMEGCYGTLV